MPASENIIWRKAAVLGSLWAASEIVLGSFLHNVRVPLKGELLTAIGIAILVAGHRLWPERGLLWRTGFICAAMKSVSPSAAIFGPMVAISMEGLLAEAGIRLLGANTAGYLLAGGLAMCWSIVHKLGNLLIFYGPDTVGVYLRGVEWLRARLDMATAGLWTPLGILLAVYFLAGALAAAAGLRSRRVTITATGIPAAKGPDKPRPAVKNEEHNHSLSALLMHMAFVAAVMAAGRKIPLAALAAVAVVYACLCARFYVRARELLKHTGIWLGILAASAVAGFVLGNFQAGLYMAFRAVLLTLAFAAIGVELRHPAIRGWLERLGGGIFFETLEYAFASLPGIIARLPTGREFARRPLTALGAAIADAPYLLEGGPRPPVFVITGPHGSGKSGFVAQLASGLRAAGKKPGGICAAGFWESGQRSGFDVINLATEERLPLSRRGLAGTAVVAGSFGFYPEGLAAGAKALSFKGLSGADAVFIDEIGFLELEGGGWAQALETVLREGKTPVVLVCRDYLLEEVRRRWGLESAAVWRIGEISVESALTALL